MTRLEKERLRDWLLKSVRSNLRKSGKDYEGIGYNSMLPLELINDHSSFEDMLNDALDLNE